MKKSGCGFIFLLLLVVMAVLLSTITLVSSIVHSNSFGGVLSVLALNAIIAIMLMLRKSFSNKL